jgi:multicomponent Na+:H+ antiporter subunit D
VLRVVCYVFGPEAASWCGGAGILAWFAVATILLSSLVAMRQDNMKARLAFSTVGQLSYIVLGIAVLAPYSIAGAIFHIVAHAFLKITLFMSAGAIFVTTGLSEISTMGGLAKRMPATFTCFATVSLGIAGLPMMAGFVTKMNILQGAWMMGKPFFMATLVAAALLALTYLMPVVQMAFGKGTAGQVPAHKHGQGGHGGHGGHGHGYGHGEHGHGGKAGFDAAPAMLVPLMITAVIAIILGCEPNAGVHLYDLAQMAAEAITKGGM